MWTWLIYNWSILSVFSFTNRIVASMDGKALRWTFTLPLCYPQEDNVFCTLGRPIFPWLSFASIFQHPWSFGPSKIFGARGRNTIFQWSKLGWEMLRRGLSSVSWFFAFCVGSWGMERLRDKLARILFYFSHKQFLPCRSLTRMNFSANKVTCQT